MYKTQDQVSYNDYIDPQVSSVKPQDYFNEYKQKIDFV